MGAAADRPANRPLACRKKNEVESEPFAVTFFSQQIPLRVENALRLYAPSSTRYHARQAGIERQGDRWHRLPLPAKERDGSSDPGGVRTFFAECLLASPAASI
jgi:hypothetical protein